MKRLNKENINTPELSEQIFKERWKECPHWVDMNRFKKLAKYYEGGRYLDIGCFNSPMPSELKLKYPNAEICAIDHAEKVVEKMKGYFPDVFYKVGDVRSLPYKDEYFDYAVAGEVLEHMERPEPLLKEWMRVLKPGGWLAISVPFKEEIHGRTGVSNEHMMAFEESDFEGETEVYNENIYAWLQK